MSAPAAVLMLGGDPTGFLVPFLPSETQVIRVQSNLTGLMSPIFVKLVSNMVAAEQSSGRHFYVLTSADEAASAPDVVGEYGFSVGPCEALETFAGPPGYYQICRLTEEPQVTPRA